MMEARPVPLDALLCRIDDIRLAIPCEPILEVVRAVLPAQLPGAPGVVLGLVDVRGRMAVLVDVRSRFGLRTRPIHAMDHFVVVDADGVVLAFPVDRVAGVLDVALNDMDAVPEMAGAPHTQGIVRFPDGLVLVHDVRTFLAPGEGAAILGALDAAEIRP
jgi:purine-binding chemotaxis protein CheW